MPYITCPDGNIYSRYDQSPYVIDCIRKEDSAINARNIACMKDPKCVENMRQIQINAYKYTFCTIGIILVLCVIFLRLRTEINQYVRD